MSIRAKILLGLAAVFAVNLLLLGGYYRFFLRDEVSDNLQNAQARVDEATRQAAELLEQGGISDIGTALSAREYDKLEFSVTDIERGEVLYKSRRLSGDLGVRSAAVARPGNRLLLVEATWYFKLSAVRAVALVRQVLAVEVAVMAVFLVLIAAVLRYGLLEPVTALNRRMTDYRKGKKPEPAAAYRRDELGQLTREFDRLTRALDEEKRLQEQIIASISHDIRTPLTSVMGYVERLIKGGVRDEERVRRYLETIYSRAQSMNLLVADFDAFLASSAQALKTKPVATEYLCGLIREEYGDELQSEGVVLTVENLAGDAVMEADLGKMRRVFGNLIGNAVRHAAPAGPLSIRVRCRREGGNVSFAVSDNGSGVAPEELEHIFEPFRTGDAARGEGRGLGLAICRSIVEAHGGRIRAEAAEEGGLAVVLSLPAAT